MKKIREASPNRFLIALYLRLFSGKKRYYKNRLKHENRLSKLAILTCNTSH